VNLMIRILPICISDQLPLSHKKFNNDRRPPIQWIPVKYMWNAFFASLHTPMALMSFNAQRNLLLKSSSHYRYHTVQSEIICPCISLDIRHIEKKSFKYTLQISNHISHHVPILCTMSRYLRTSVKFTQGSGYIGPIWNSTRSAGREIPRFLWNPKVYYRVPYPVLDASSPHLPTTSL